MFKAASQEKMSFIHYVSKNRIHTINMI